MLEPDTYRTSERLAKAQLPTWWAAQTHNLDHFERAGFPVRISSLREIGQLLDTMQENRFDSYMRELGGLTYSEYALLIQACRDVVLFQLTFLSNRRPILPLSTLLSSFALYRKFLAVDAKFRSVLEIGPGCGYLSFFLRHHAPLQDYSQIEACESFYLLQNLVNQHCFGAHFEERALLPEEAPVLNHYFPAAKRLSHVEISRALPLRLKHPLCSHYPWWRIGDLVSPGKTFQIVTSNANLLEFNRTALDDYLSLVQDVLEPDGAFIVQCLGYPASGTIESLIDKIWEKGFATLLFVLAGKPVAPPLQNGSTELQALLNGAANARVFAVPNCLFVKPGHPLFDKYRDRANCHTHFVANEKLVSDVFFARPAGLRMYAAREFIEDTMASLQEICAPG
ncbi:hypothetical protein [Bradyrhizobium sp.]|uniref:hypothetical protein n=1 Tax=Bradyrhizobium sp. TaxID=376 RepID=UPI003C356B76